MKLNYIIWIFHIKKIITCNAALTLRNIPMKMQIGKVEKISKSNQQSNEKMLPSSNIVITQNNIYKIFDKRILKYLKPLEKEF